MKALFTNQRGDTIVEVLIAITILAFVFTGAYLTANTSYNNIHTSQERSQAVYIAQNQFEDLRAQADNLFYSGSPNNGSESSGFCFTVSNTYQSGTCAISSSSISSGPGYQAEIVDCSSSGTSCSNSPPTTVGTTTFIIKVTWLGVGGASQQLQEYYRLGVI